MGKIHLKRFLWAILVSPLAYFFELGESHEKRKERRIKRIEDLDR